MANEALIRSSARCGPTSKSTRPRMQRRADGTLPQQGEGSEVRCSLAPRGSVARVFGFTLETISERCRRFLRRTRSTAGHSPAAPITRAARSQLSEGVIRMEKPSRGGAMDFEGSSDLWL